MSKIHFDLLSSYLIKRDVENAKRLVTRDNILDTDRNGDGIIAHIIWHFHDDSNGVMLIRYFFDLGASLHTIDVDMGSPLHIAAHCRKPESTRELINLGVPVNSCNEYNYTPLTLAFCSCSFRPNDNESCARVLLDAGAQLSLVQSIVIPQWARDFVEYRNTLCDASIIVLGLKRCYSNVVDISKNSVDVLRIIAKCMWGLRGVKK